MTTVQTVLTSAYRRSGMVAAGVPVSMTLLTVGLERVIDLVRGMVGDGTLGGFRDVWLTTGSTYTALEWDRITSADNTTVVTIPNVYYDAGDVYDPNDYGFVGSNPYVYNSGGKPRPPRDGAMIIQNIVGGGTAPGIVMWDIYSSQWVNLEGLTLASYCPFSFRGEEGLKNWLGAMLADEAGYQVRPSLARSAGLFKYKLLARYDSKHRSRRVGEYL